MVNSSTTNQPSNKQPIRLGIWGLSGSGKTVYMTMLYHYLSQGDSPWRIVTDDEHTENFVNENLRLIIDHGKFCPTTEIPSTEIYSYKLVNDKTKKIIEIRFFDLPGKFYMDLLNQDIQIEGETLRLIQYLNQCHGILFLISPLEEDSPDRDKGSYATFLGNLFRSMQRSRDSQKESKLEPYIVFCITKIDHPDVNKKSSGRKAENWLLKLLGPTVKLGWIANFFHAQIDVKTNTFSPDPGELNRCRAMLISCFGVDNHGNSPVVPLVYEEQGQESASQSLDPVLQMHNSNPSYRQYESPTLSQGINGDQSKPIPRQYKISLEEGFYPINMLSPIEWILKGVEKYYPNVSSSKSEEQT